MKDKNEYVSAGVVPYKICKNTDLISTINKANMIQSVHPMVFPTNVCNLNCTFCSFKDREKQQKWSDDDVIRIPKLLNMAGAKAVTISGGGSPCLHPKINEIITNFAIRGVRIGIIDNGLALTNLKKSTLKLIDWIRISVSDDRNLDDFKENLKYLIINGQNIDRSFSYVVTNHVNFKNVIRVIEIANTYGFSHVRFVNDLYNNIDFCAKIPKYLKENGINTDICIFQGTKNHTKGQKICSVSLLKPIIDANGDIYPCCSMIYDDIDNRMIKSEFSMGNYINLPKLVNNQTFFDGSKCKKCYYNDYNNMLNNINKDYKHYKFV